MKKIIIPLFLLLFLPVASMAAELRFSADKNSVATDEVLTVRLSVDGQIDNGQIGIEGMENFNLVGQQSSSRMQVINGQSTITQEKIFSLSPIDEGDFSLKAIAFSNGEKVESESIPITVEKSLIDSTKEKLIGSSSVDEEDIRNISSPQGEVDNQIKSDSSDNLKDLLTSPPPKADRSVKTDLPLSVSPIESFPKVQHLSAFNALFWIQFTGIFFALGMIILGIYRILLRGKNKMHVDKKG
jgi:hypothetical protein